MADEIWDSKDGPVVDFSGDKRGVAAMAARSKLTEYQDIDLASGFHKELIWTTKDGRRIAVPNMSDSHLLNTIAFIRRRVLTYKKQIAMRWLMRANAASMLFDALPDEVADKLTADAFKDIEKLWKMPDEDFLRKVFPIYTHMYQEAYKRKILLEVDASKLLDQSQPKSKEPKERVYRKPIGPELPLTDDEIIGSFLQAAFETDGIEVYKDDWEWAEKAAAQYPLELDFSGPARGPDRAWKRLHYVGDRNG